MLLIWGRIIHDVVGHWVAIDHVVQQRLYQGGGITAPSPVAGAVYDILGLGNRSGYGPEINPCIAGPWSLDGWAIRGCQDEQLNVRFTPESGHYRRKNG